MYVNHIIQFIDWLTHFLSFFDESPVWLTAKPLEHIVDSLLDKAEKPEVRGFFLSKVKFSIENWEDSLSIEGHKEKEKKEGCEETASVGNSIKDSHEPSSIEAFGLGGK